MSKPEDFSLTGWQIELKHSEVFNITLPTPMTREQALDAAVDAFKAIIAVKLERVVYGDPTQDYVEGIAVPLPDDAAPEIPDFWIAIVDVEDEGETTRQVEPPDWEDSIESYNNRVEAAMRLVFGERFQKYGGVRPSYERDREQARSDQRPRLTGLERIARERRALGMDDPGSE
jgi:hypothetical protein